MKEGGTSWHTLSKIKAAAELEAGGRRGPEGGRDGRAGLPVLTAAGVRTPGRESRSHTKKTAGRGHRAATNLISGEVGERSTVAAAAATDGFTAAGFSGGPPEPWTPPVAPPGINLSADDDSPSLFRPLCFLPLSGASCIFSRMRWVSPCNDRANLIIAPAQTGHMQI
jgi:hypothetical protein